MRYHFGNFDVYCPWDVMNYLRDLGNTILRSSHAAYWKNTSDNALSSVLSSITLAAASPKGWKRASFSGGYVCSMDDNLTYDYLLF